MQRSGVRERENLDERLTQGRTSRKGNKDRRKGYQRRGKKIKESHRKYYIKKRW